MTSLIVKDYTADSLWADLGGVYKEKSFDRKIQALTNPKGYAADRKTAIISLDKIKAQSEAAFKTSYDGFMAAGLSPDAAKAAAYQSAQSEYANQMRVFNLMFGQGTDQVYQVRQGRQGAGNYRSMLGGDVVARSAAPANRRRRRKK